MTPSLFAPVPPETSKALQGIEIQNLGYLAVGEQVSEVLEGSGLSQVDFAPEKSRSYVAMLALATLFEHAEGYTDTQAAEAARNRMDWKYALHLPISYPGFEAGWLCRFREYAFSTAAGAAFLHRLSERMRGIAPELFDNDGAGAPDRILTSICQLNRIVQLTEAMLLAVEALAAESFVLPDGVPMHLLYTSYAKRVITVREKRDPAQIAELAAVIGGDIEWLLRSVDAKLPEGLGAVPEIAHLRQVRDEQFERGKAGETPERDDVLVWKPADCEHCNLRAA